MVKLLRSVFFVLLLSIGVYKTSALIDDVVEIVHIGKDVLVGILKTWEFVEQHTADGETELPQLLDKQNKLIKKLKNISKLINRSEAMHKNTAAWTIETLHALIKKDTRLELEMHQMRDIRNRIKSQMSEMLKYQKFQKDLEETTLIKFAEWTVSPNPHAVNSLLERLHELFVGSGDCKGFGCKTIMSQISENLKSAREQICATQQSPQQFLYSLYSDISLTELKGYTMMQFSWMMLKIYGKGNFTRESQLMREDFEKRSQRTLKVVQESMKVAERTVWRCDPNQHKKGETYEEVTRLLQGYIENEVDMNPDGTCRENCAYYGFTKNHGCCFKDSYCARQPKCTGHLLNCQYIDSDMWICPSNSSSSRRYEYIEYESGRVLGKKEYCTRGTTKVESWWRWLFWHCSYCLCICDERGPKSDRYFSLRPSISDIENDMVMTGIRFKKEKRIFHLQIQQGQLLPRGNVNASTVTWKNLDSFNIFDKNVREGTDFHTLAWNKRAIDLDDVSHNDPNFVITGVRFRVLGAHLNLEIHVTEFNFENGKLNPEKTFWKSNDITVGRREINLKSPDNSAKSYLKSFPTSKHNQYIEFNHSDLDKDLAQSTVPFIDIQEVISKPPVLLSGLGIYHKGRDGYGGFIAPKLMTYDFTSYMGLK